MNLRTRNFRGGTFEKSERKRLRLAASSNKLEGLTITLKWLTITLIVITVLASAVPVGIELWKAYQKPEIEMTPVNPSP